MLKASYTSSLRPYATSVFWRPHTTIYRPHTTIYVSAAPDSAKATALSLKIPVYEALVPKAFPCVIFFFLHVPQVPMPPKRQKSDTAVVRAFRDLFFSLRLRQKERECAVVRSFRTRDSFFFIWFAAEER